MQNRDAAGFVATLIFLVGSIGFVIGCRVGSGTSDQTWERWLESDEKTAAIRARILAEKAEREAKRAK